MKTSARILIGLAVCGLLGRTARGQNDEEQARKFAEAAIRIGAIDYLTDRDFKIDGRELVATARAIDPKEHVKVKLIDLKLLPGRADVKFRIDARFRFEGKVTTDETSTDVRGEANIGQTIACEAKYWSDDQGLHVDAKATEIKFGVKVHELTPEDAAGGKTGFAKITVAQLRRQKEELLREFNEWQAKYSQRLK